MDNNKRLTRSTTDRQVAGVAGGLAEYFKIDPTLVRVLFVLFTLMGGPGVLVYIVLWLVMPEDKDVFYEFEKPKNEDAI